MIARSTGPEPGTVAVGFITEPLAWEQTVSVVGEFNDWDHTRNPLQPGADGRWRARVVLPAGGRYAFRYLTGSGRWFNEVDADDYREDGAGRVNSILDLTRWDSDASAPAGGQ